MDRVASVEIALQRADAILAREPTTAIEQARHILEAVPEHPKALLIEGAGLAQLGDYAAAEAVLRPLAAAQPRAARVWAEWGGVLAATGDRAGAIAALRRAVGLKAGLPEAWRVLGDLLLLEGRAGEAEAAYAGHLRASVHDPELMAAASALCEGELSRAERLLKARVRAAPTDVAALRMLAEVATRLGRYRAAEVLLEECLVLAPGFLGARHHYAVVLYRQNRNAEAVRHLEVLVAAEPRDANYANLLAASLAGVGEYARAIAIYAGLVPAWGGQAKFWMSYGHVLRTAGRHDEAVAAYRRCLELAPGLGEAWWSLANLKTGTLDAGDAGRMRAALEGAGVSAEDRYHLHYALGRVADEAGEADLAFAEYAAGARLRRAEVSYDAGQVSAQVAHSIALFTPGLIAARAGGGCADGAPIFVVGLPRAGSTLIEQMLASHPEVEGTMELPEIPNIVRELSGGVEGGRYPACIAALDDAALAGWGARYLERARVYRRTGRARFIDKLPNNWLHVPLIRLMLPRATIIDARRGAMATCFSAFRQHFARGQLYSYDLAELGRFYRDYLAMMAHVDAVAPGAVHRVSYEAMVEDTEGELRRLLAACGLGWDAGASRSMRTGRAVRTASSEQVRRPIYREGLEEWRRYEAWLGPLKEALGGDLGVAVRTT